MVSPLPRRAAIAGALVFVGAIGLEIAHLLHPRPDPGFDAAASWVIGLGLIALWALAAIATASRKRIGLVAAIVGAAALLLHGLVGSVAHSAYGIGFAGLAPVAAVLVRLAFGGPVRLGSRTTPPPREGPDASSVV